MKYHILSLSMLMGALTFEANAGAPNIAPPPPEPRTGEVTTNTTVCFLSPCHQGTEVETFSYGKGANQTENQALEVHIGTYTSLRLNSQSSMIADGCAFYPAGTMVHVNTTHQVKGKDLYGTVRTDIISGGVSGMPIPCFSTNRTKSFQLSLTLNGVKGLSPKFLGTFDYAKLNHESNDRARVRGFMQARPLALFALEEYEAWVEGKLGDLCSQAGAQPGQFVSYQVMISQVSSVAKEEEMGPSEVIECPSRNIAIR